MKPDSILNFAPVAILGLATVCMPLLALTQSPDGPDAAIVFPPGWQAADVMRAVAAADVAVVRFGVTENIGIVELSGEDDIARLRAAGAWFVLPPQVFGGCLLGSAQTGLSPSPTVSRARST